MNEQMDAQQPSTLTVSQLNRRARQLLETHLPLVWVEGEISNFSRPGSGHWYLTLKDEQAQVRCAMFRNRNNLVRFSPDNGSHVLIRCRVSIYEGRGDFQLIIEHMEEAGYGALQRQFDELKHRLSQEGLFNQEYKQSLPSLPKRIGLITSPTGAALKDILSILKRRFPSIPITLFPSMVQGKTAAVDLANQITRANNIPEDNEQRCDVLLLSRGGGSIEDLWAFNEEILARSIYNSEIPIVSAVGHETDFTIADFVADYRAATPSAAAEILSPDGEQLLENFEAYEQLLTNVILQRINTIGQRVDYLNRRLRHPGEKLAYQQTQLKSLELRLKQAALANLNSQRHRIGSLEGKIYQNHPNQLLENMQLQLQGLEQRLNSTIKNTMHHKLQRWNNAVQLLNTVSPLNTLQRGYAIVLDQEQHVVRSVSEKKPGEQISTKLMDGSLLCTIDKIISET